jgi:amino acid transporter
MTEQTKGKIGYWEVVSIGIGGMVGGGIFAVLGLAVELAHGGTPVAFAIAGLVALITAYSYTKLSVTFPSQGGTVTFLDRAFGPGVLTGGFNVLLWLSYVVMLSLYAFAFGSYGATFLPDPWQDVGKHVMISLSIIGIAALNFMSAKIIGEVENWVVGLKLAILLLFVAIGLRGVNAAQLAPASWSPLPHLIAGGMIIFVAYEGFELIANTAHDVKKPVINLPRAYYTAVASVILLYVLVAIVAVGNLSVGKIASAKDYALAEAAKPFLGNFGFTLIAIAALLSTASAINATLYGAARLSYNIAQDGELPALLEKKIWHEPLAGLFITTILTLLVANFLDLTSISTVGSAGFLLIFAAVNGANIRLASSTGSRPWISGIGIVTCGGAMAALLWQTATSSPQKLWLLGAMFALAFGIEAGYRALTGRKIRLSSTQLT